MPDNEHTGLRDKLAAVVREAGVLALAAWKNSPKRWMKAGSSPVSETDIAVNDFLSARLPPLSPDTGWLSEETEDNPARATAYKVWVVDPIDGTRAFLDQRSDWSISVALVEHGRPVIAALFAPATDELLLASHGAGATLNGAPLKVSPGDDLAGARFAGPQRLLDTLIQLQPQILPQPKVHSLALRLARVATGELEAAFASRNSHDWDLAAADLLVHEAGGKLTDFAGQALRYNRPEPVHRPLIAAGPARHAAIVHLLRDHAREFA